MFKLSDITHPIIVAPMAGGPSTPQLVARAAEQGFLGFLAAGYKTPENMALEIETVRQLTSNPFGINLFVPNETSLNNNDKQILANYRQKLLPIAEKLKVSLPEISQLPTDGQDFFSEKIAYLYKHPLPVVSFTFGLPEQKIIHQLQAKNIAVFATVTNLTEALLAEEIGINAITLQSSEAGGHRATFIATEPANLLDSKELLKTVRPFCKLPVNIAGGIYCKQQIAELLNIGADACQLGSYFLGADEAGTTTTYKQALLSGKYTKTQVTRAFTGREARGLENTFVKEFSAISPALYPAVHYLTLPIRQQAAKTNQPEYLHLWAGINYQEIKKMPIEKLLNMLVN